MRFTPEHVLDLRDNEIFVFGSNTEGAHAGGAAYIARTRFGAIDGQPEGVQGQSYAIPTLTFVPQDDTPDKLPRVVPVTDAELEDALDRFLTFAYGHPEYTFVMTKIGCGIAGWRIEQVGEILIRVAASFFRGLPTNVVWPREFYEILKDYGVVD